VFLPRMAIQTDIVADPNDRYRSASTIQMSVSSSANALKVDKWVSIARYGGRWLHSLKDHVPEAFLFFGSKRSIPVRLA
jgi:bifunctional pyridoxal-dependent enzyme with beta-cystathionase and maltose regulon repressor activities